MSRVVRARYEKGVLKLLEKVDLEEGEEVEVIVRRRVFTREDLEEIASMLKDLPKGKVEYLEVVEDLYYEEALR